MSMGSTNGIVDLQGSGKGHVYVSDEKLEGIGLTYNEFNRRRSAQVVVAPGTPPAKHPCQCFEWSKLY